MTKAAKHYGKEAKEFLRLPSTRAYADEMSKAGFPHLCEVTRGRYGSTWAHPKLAVFFARWLDVRFAVWCDLMIDEILRGRAVVAPIPEDHPPLTLEAVQQMITGTLSTLLPQLLQQAAPQNIPSPTVQTELPLAVPTDHLRPSEYLRDYCGRPNAPEVDGLNTTLDESAQDPLREPDTGETGV